MNVKLLRKAGVVGVTAVLGAATTPGAFARVSEAAPANSQGTMKLREPAAATPAMLQTVSPTAKGSNVKIGNASVRVSAEQLAAYNALPAAVRVKLKAPVAGKVLSAAELKKIGSSYSTVMCPW